MFHDKSIHIMMSRIGRITKKLYKRASCIKSSCACDAWLRKNVHDISRASTGYLPPANSHIPPGEKENHRLKSAFLENLWVPRRVCFFCAKKLWQCSRNSFNSSSKDKPLSGRSPSQCFEAIGCEMVPLSFFQTMKMAKHGGIKNY